MPPLRAVGACCCVGGPRLPFPPRWPHALSARDFWGGNLASVGPLFCSRAGAHALGFRPPPPSTLFPLGSMSPHGGPLRRPPPRWLDLSPSPTTAVCFTHGAGTYRFQTSCRRRLWIALAGGPRRCLPLPSPSSLAALPLPLSVTCLPVAQAVSGFLSPPPAPVRPPLVIPGPL